MGSTIPPLPGVPPLPATPTQAQKPAPAPSIPVMPAVPTVSAAPAAPTASAAPAQSAPAVPAPAPSPTRTSVPSPAPATSSTPVSSPAPHPQYSYYNEQEHAYDDQRREQRLSLTIIYKTRSITIDVGPAPIIAEVLPDIARRLGALDPTIAHSGYHLVTEEGIDLSPAQTFGEQHVSNNSVLTLHPGLLDDDEIIYDDVVEAVGDSVAHTYTAWTTEQTMMSSLLISMGMLLMGAGLLAVLPSTLIHASLALGSAVILITISAVLHARSLTLQSNVIGLTAALYGAIGGYHMVATYIEQHSFYDSALLGACAGLIIFGSIQAILCARTRPYAYLPIAIGAVVAIPTLISTVFPQNMLSIWIITSAVVAIIGNFLPWAALSYARLSVQSPQSEMEIFELPEDIDIARVREQYISGSTLLYIARVASAALLLLATPLLAAQSEPFAGCMAIVIFLAMLIGSRQVYAARQMVIIIGTAALGIMLTCTIYIAHHPQQASLLTIAIIGCAVLTVIMTYVTRHQSLFASRVADAAEVMCLVLVLPLAYFAIGM